jgi:hypothetical protein
MQGLAGQCEMRLADDLGLGRVRVDQLGHIRGFGVPVIDQLALGDELANPAAHQVDAEHAPRPGAIGFGDDLGRPLRLQDDALAVAAQRVVHLDDLKTALRDLS